MFMPSTCRFLNSEDIKPVGSHPVAAGGLADIWEATHDGRKIALSLIVATRTLTLLGSSRYVAIIAYAG